MNLSLLKNGHYRHYKTLIFLLFVILLVAGYAWLYSLNSVEKRIRRGEIQFSHELGWINWGHAKPAGTLEAFNRLQYDNLHSKDSFYFCYSQKMKFKVGSRSVVAEFTQCRNIRTKLSLQEEQEAFLEIFMGVSEGFEKMQSRFPYVLMEVSPGSSFREGDLTGNLLSFYSAAYNVSTDSIHKKLTMLKPEGCALKYDQEGLGKDLVWNIEAVDKQSDLKETLNRWVNKTLAGKIPFSRIISQRVVFYFE